MGRDGHAQLRQHLIACGDQWSCPHVVHSQGVRKDWWHAGTWKEPYWRMQKGCAVLLVMDCSQNTCSGHCTTELFRIRFRA